MNHMQVLQLLFAFVVKTLLYIDLIIDADTLSINRCRVCWRIQKKVSSMTNRELLLHRPGLIEYRSCDFPSKPIRNQVMVRVEYITLCGTDHAIFDGKYEAPSGLPMRFGHEWSGIVEEVGDNVIHIKPGDRVTGDCSSWCGECDNCGKDQNLCRQINKFGITIDGFSTHRRLVDAKYLYVAPNCIKLPTLALAEPFSVSLHGLVKAGVSDYEPVGGAAIVGAGALGVATALLLRLKFGWQNVRLYEKSEFRRKLVEKHFPEIAEILVTPKPSDIEDDYARMYQGGKPVLVCEASGSAKGLSLALNLAQAGGSVLLYGIFADPIEEMRLTTLKGLRILGTIGGTGQFPSILEFFSHHQHIVQRFITSSYSSENASEAFSPEVRHKNLKIQIRMGDNTI